MHNSLFIRDILRSTNNDPLCRQRRDPHRTVICDPEAGPGHGEFALKGSWRVESPSELEPAEVIREDAEDFLERIGVSVSHDGRNRLAFILDDTLKERDCRLSFRPHVIQIKGGGTSGLWAGLAWMEWEMRTRRGPFLPMGEFTKSAAWPVQISQGPWGGNYSVPDFSSEYLSDDAFRLYAHYGVNSMMIYGHLLCYIQSDILPELNHPDYDHHIIMLKDAARRAARYGVRFTYVVVGAKLRPDHPVFQNHPEVRGAGTDRLKNGNTLHFLCSSSPKVLAFYEETFEKLFREVPELAGLILITFSESFYHCRIWDVHTKVACPSCSNRPVDEMLSNLISAVDRGMRKSKPDAFLAMWVYSWSQGDRRVVFQRLPGSVDVFHHIEKDQIFQKDGYKKRIWDYSIDYTGPSDDMTALAAFAHETNRPLFVKTETGIGLEVIQFPYVPAMQHLAEKWQKVRDLKPYGVHQSWLFFGMFGSRAEELGIWAAYAPDISRDEFLKRMALRDFGPSAVEDILKSWACMSRAVRHLPCVHLQYYYVGPSFLGPAHPLVPEKGEDIPEKFYAYLFYRQEGEETFSVKHIEESKTCLVMHTLPESSRYVGVIPDDPDSDGWDIVICEYAAAAREARAAWKHLRAAEQFAKTDMDVRNLREELLLTELLYRTFRSCENTVRFLYARKRYEDTGESAHHEEMIRIARLEKENSLAAVPIYREAPWLDLPRRTDGKYNACADMINEKVKWIDRFLPCGWASRDLNPEGISATRS